MYDRIIRWCVDLTRCCDSRVFEVFEGERKEWKRRKRRGGEKGSQDRIVLGGQEQVHVRAALRREEERYVCRLLVGGIMRGGEEEEGGREKKREGGKAGRLILGGRGRQGNPFRGRGRHFREEEGRRHC